MLSSTKIIIFLSLMTMLMSSCIINRDFILQTDEDFIFNVPFIDSTNREYKIPINSSVSVSVFTRNGDLIFESMTGPRTSGSQISQINGINSSPEFFMDASGNVQLPLVGEQRLVGLTISEAQDFLTDKFSNYFVEPFCIVKVRNRRFLYFSGSGGQGNVIEMGSNRINIFEAIALGGGLNSRANSAKVKVIRNIDGTKQVFNFDLSRIDALQYTDFYIESGDILLVEPMPQFATELLTVINPVLTLTSTILLYLSVVVK